ncbi:retrovirus-related Pol polyprotein from transposon 297 [Elysia marginata]|uniref:Retrovirus-related Pol polyprotein from transposon 297 n=1 Tax=Elysia marginata TaxID=1093978 RepID=A0AAV4FRK1_9GAST|nr:retrovirus-related Pol polyprotein from transposon 297 [Elysia marginata]
MFFARTTLAVFVLTAAVVYASEVSDNWSCTGGWKRSIHSRTCIKVYTQKKSWYNARRTCQSARGDLVKILNSGMNKFLLDQTFSDGDNYDFYWIGLHQYTPNRQFRWLSKRTVPRYTRWFPQHPIVRSIVTCVDLSRRHSGYWLNYDCDDKDNFICERPRKECSRGKYGLSCSHRCSHFCSGSYNDCQILSGECLFGCNPGYIGPKCDKQCPAGKYGLKCSNTCSFSCSGSHNACHHVSGRCLHGCDSGYIGVKCDQQCPAGKYGLKCSNTCSFSCGGSDNACHHFSGRCLNGCDSGYIGVKCDQQCPTGKYGPRCSNTCSISCGGSHNTCHHVSGQCLHGCDPGYTGIKCDQHPSRMSLPTFPKFKIREDELSVRTRWRKWIQQLENLLTGMNIEADERKKALLIHYGGEEIFDLVDTFSDVQKSNFDALKISLTNHFKKSSRKQERHKTAVKQIHHEDDESDSDSAGVFQINTGKSIPTLTADLCSNQVKFIVDTGASVNILTKTSYKMHKKPILRPDPIAINGYSNSEKLDVLGRFTASIQCNGEKTQATFYVVQAPEKACNLLSATTSQELKIISFLNNVTISENLFEGFGKIKGIKIKLHIDEKVQPVAQKHRRIPNHIRKDTEAELKRLEEQDIIENVEGSTPWVSPIVVIPKKTGGVRLCVDMRRANEAIKSERHPMPTLEEVINELNGSKFFSRLDLKQAFHQLELSEESRHITTFATHVGLRRYKRLMFGINAAPELFQHHLNQILHDIQGATNYIDDVIIFGKTREEHDRNLQATLDRLQEQGVKLNKDKCLFGARKLTFLGHVFGEDGIHLEPQKIKCISEATAPTNIAAVKSFLGMTQYVSRFIRGYATITEPFCMLTKKTQPWTKGKPQQDASDQLKSALTNAGVIYNPGKDELNPADYLCRHPTNKPTRDNKGEDYIS